ncbi:MAG: carboxypeptidase-like regulatory domain-containing protein [Sphingobacteriaceae bacterium]
MRFRLFFFFMLLVSSVFAQKTEPKLVQFSGVIFNRDSNTVIPYVSITNQGADKKSAYVANYKGYFSFVAHAGDTLTFSAVGYSRQTLTIPQNLPDDKYTVRVNLKQEIVSLPMVRVYPWASEEEFKKDFLTMKIADDDLEIAKKNVSNASIVSLARTLQRDGQEIQSMNFRNNHFALGNKNINQRANNPLLNPFAWAAFIDQITKGSKKTGN